MRLFKQRGQALSEYLILVCLVGVAAIAVVSVVGTNIKEQFANVSNALRGEKKVPLTKTRGQDHQKRGMDDYME